MPGHQGQLGQVLCQLTGLHPVRKLVRLNITRRVAVGVHSGFSRRNGWHWRGFFSNRVAVGVGTAFNLLVAVAMPPQMPVAVGHHRMQHYRQVCQQQQQGLQPTTVHWSKASNITQYGFQSPHITPT